MATRAKRYTIHLNPELHEALRLKSVETSRSISELVNEAVRASLGEDAEDTAVFKARASELLVSYDEMVRKLKKEGRI
jgi:predicted DNA-binding protein